MSEAIAVLNAGSSSIKFSLFLARDGALELLLRGQIEALFTQPSFEAKDPGGGDCRWLSGRPSPARSSRCGLPLRRPTSPARRRDRRIA